MAEAGGPTSAEAGLQDSVPEEANANSIAEPDPLEGNIDSNLETGEEGEEDEGAEEEEEEDEEDEEGDGEAEEEEEEVEESTSLPPLPPPPAEPSVEQEATGPRYGGVIRLTATTKQSAIKAAVLRRVQVNPVELSSDTVAVAHSPPSSPAQQSPLKKTRQIRTRTYARK